VKPGRRLVAAAVLAVSLVCAAAALAAIPNKGTYRGKTTQGRNLRIKVNKHHNLPDGGFRINWAAPCQVDTEKRWGPEQTENNGGIDVKDDGTFKLDGRYNSTVGDYVGHIRIKNSGEFDTATSAAGTFEVRVRVTKNGDDVDICKKTVHWSVTRVSG
jgi:hypothetical protein